MSRATHRLQRGAAVVLGLLVILLVADSAFLATAATPEGLLGPMLRLHIALGACMSAVLAVFVGSHVSTHRRHRNVQARRIGLIVAALAGAGCVVGLGLWLFDTTLTEGSSGRSLVLAHELAFGLAIVAYLGHRLRAQAAKALRVEWIGAGVAALMVAGIWIAQLAWPRTDVRIDAPARALYEPGLSQARTVDGHVLGPEDLANPDYCAQCHGEIAARWASSAHRFSSLNDPFYAATLADAQTHRDPDQLKFCGGCHDPLLLLTGRMDAHPRPGDPDADAGITCLACHAIVERPSRIGNGSYVVAAPNHYPGYASEDPDEQATSRRSIRTQPAQHIESFGPPHLREAELCLACHKAHIPPELNDHRWLRGQNEFDPWRQSGAGGESARTFYAPGERKRCQDCHMPRIRADDPAARDGMVADHAMLGANTALPQTLGDADWRARNEAFLVGVVSLDVGAVEFALASERDPNAGPPAQNPRVLAPEGPVQAPAGVPVTVDLVVRNRRSGHLFPGGIADLREVWLELSLLDGEGQALLVSGWLDPGGALDPDAHRWNAVLLDGEGRPLTIHDVEDTHVVLSARRIMLGASDVIRVAFEAPAGPSRLRARVLDRKFPRDYVEYALGEDAPRMPIVEIAAVELALEPGAIEAKQAGEATGPRLRDLGIGHLLRGDTTLAREAATLAVARMPDDPGPHLDLARAELLDGDLAAAEAEIREADQLAPGHPTAAWLLARVRAGRGQHEQALAALEVALAAFPVDSELLVMRGESLFRLERDEEAREALEQALVIDPEHLGAHALLARIYDERGDAARAGEHERAWDRFRPRSEDQAVSELARRAYPALDRRANEQYLLELAPPPAGWQPAE